MKCLRSKNQRAMYVCKLVPHNELSGGATKIAASAPQTISTSAEVFCWAIIWYN
jgi:hypothetical protein